MRASAYWVGFVPLALLFISMPAFGQIPLERISFQGVLQDSNAEPVPDGDYDLTFRLYTAPSGDSAFWTEDRTGVNAIAVTDGVFNVLLGSISSLSGVAFDDQYFLGITVGSDSEILPRTEILAVPYARTIPNVYPTNSLVEVDAPLSVGTSGSEALFTLRGPDDPVNGPVQFLYGDTPDQFESGRIRFSEAGTGNWRGAYIHYDGSAPNNLHIGVHPSNDSNVANDVNVITVERSSNPQVGIGTESPNRELTVNDTDADGDAYVNVTAGGQEVYMGIAQNGQARLSVQTDTELRIRTNQSTRIAVKADGDVEIWDDLEVDGEIRTASNGNAMMVPRAWGAVNSSGTLLTNSGNVSVSRISTGSYNVTLTNGCVSGTSHYVVVATVNREPANTGPPGFIETQVESATCTFGVYTWLLGLTTVLADQRFSFVVYNP
jgi:hypothetical protein